MKCTDCPFSMQCLSGRVPRQGCYNSLCPSCGRFYISTGIPTLNTTDGKQVSTEAFRCEQRFLTRAIKNQFIAERKVRIARKRRSPGMVNFHEADISARIKDPVVEGEGLYVRMCPDCTNWRSPMFVRDLDLDKKDREKPRVSAFGNIGGRRDPEVLDVETVEEQAKGDHEPLKSDD